MIIHPDEIEKSTNLFKSRGSPCVKEVFYTNILSDCNNCTQYLHREEEYEALFFFETLETARPANRR